MSLFLACCCIAVVLGVCSYLSLVRPRVRGPGRELDEIRLLETWWHLEASDVSVAGTHDGEGDAVDDAA